MFSWSDQPLLFAGFFGSIFICQKYFRGRGQIWCNKMRKTKLFYFCSLSKLRQNIPKLVSKFEMFHCPNSIIFNEAVPFGIFCLLSILFNFENNSNFEFWRKLKLKCVYQLACTAWSPQHCYLWAGVRCSTLSKREEEIVEVQLTKITYSLSISLLDKIF